MVDNILKKIKDVVVETLDDEEFPNAPDAARISETRQFERHDDHSAAAEEKRSRGD